LAVQTKKKSAVDLKVINGNPVRKTKPYNDIDLNNWRAYDHVDTGTLWMFPARAKGNGHKFNYHGNYIPQIAEQLFTRYTKPDDIVLDLFLGSGTSAIEAVNMGRKCIGVELKPELASQVEEVIKNHGGRNLVDVISADSSSLEAKQGIEKALYSHGKEKAQFLVLHPPYADIIKFSDKAEDLSNCESTEEFLEMFKAVAKNGYDCLESGRYAALIIGDKYAKAELIPLGFLCMQKMNEVGFKQSRSSLKT